MRLIIILIGTLYIAACSYGYTSDLFAIKIGMIKQEVVNVLGKPDSVSSTASVTTYTYNLQKSYGSLYFPYDIDLINGVVSEFGIGAVGSGGTDITIHID